MKRYTVGFIFNEDLTKVLLIRKLRPAEQAGKVNGIGGKFEPEDIDAQHCISREVHEEAGIMIQPEMWAEVGAFSDNQYFHVAILTTTVDEKVLAEAKSLTDEEVFVADLDDCESLVFADQAREMIDFCKRNYIKNPI